MRQSESLWQLQHNKNLLRTQKLTGQCANHTGYSSSVLTANQHTVPCTPLTVADPGFSKGGGAEMTEYV